MPLQIPPDVPSWLVRLVAGPFPVGDEDALRRRAQALREVATVCSELADRHAVAVSELSDVAIGDSAAALAELGRTNTTDLRSVSDYCTSLAKQCDNAANSIEYAKKVIIVTLVMLAAQLAWDALTFFAGGAAEAPVERLAAEAEIRAAADAAAGEVAEDAVAAMAERAAIRPIVKTVVAGAIWGGVPVLVADVWMDLDHHGKGISWADVGVATLAGIGGGVAGGLVGAKVGQGLGRVLGEAGSAPNRYFEHAVVGMAGALGGGAAGGIIGGAITVIADNVIAAAHGRLVNPFHGLGVDTLIQGAASGIGGGLLGGASEALRFDRGPWRNGGRAVSEPSGEPPGPSVARDVYAPDQTRDGVDPTSASGKSERSADNADDKWKPVVTTAHPVRRLEHRGEPRRSQDVGQGRPRRVSPVGDPRRPGGANRPGEVAPPGRIMASSQQGRGEHPVLTPEMVSAGTPDRYRVATPDGGLWTPGPPPGGDPPPGGGGDFHGGGFDPLDAAGDGRGNEVEVRLGNLSVHIPRSDEIRLGRTDSPLSEHFSSYPTVSRGHATLSVDKDGRVWIRDDGSHNGTFVNEMRVSADRPVELHPGDTVKLGSEFEAGIGISRPTVVHLGDDGSIPIRLHHGDVVKLGRADDSPIHAAVSGDPRVSRYHAAIGMDDNGRVWIRDEGSTNGTFVNGGRLDRDEVFTLYRRDRLRLGGDYETGVDIAHPALPDGLVNSAEVAVEAGLDRNAAIIDPAVDEIPVPPLHPDAAARAVADFPSVFEQARTLDELHRNLRPGTSFEDLMAVRAHFHRSNGVEPPALSSESLESFLADIWERRNDPNLDMYHMYTGLEYESVLDPRRYLKDLVDIIPPPVDGAPPGASVQAKRGDDFLLSERNYTMVDPDDIYYIKYSRNFGNRVESRYRVYVNAHPPTAPDLMRGIVREIVQDGSRFPGIRLAKISGPSVARTDGIVVYVSDLESAGRVVGWLKDYQRRNPDSFGWSVPPMTNQVAPGISIGATPDRRMGRYGSFGSFRTDIIYGQLRSAKSLSDFKASVLRAFDRNGIDSMRPHRNSE